MNVIDAIVMTRRKGLRLVATDSKERLLFDAMNGIDTTTQVAKDEFTSRPDHFEHGLHSSSSWTSEIKVRFRIPNTVKPSSKRSSTVVGEQRGFYPQRVTIVYARPAVEP